ncbi:hypothetical protein GCM10009075_32440 [Sphingomonas trueperi]
MAWRRTIRSVAQAVTNGCHPFDRLINFIGFCGEQGPVDCYLATGTKHLTDRRQGQASHLPKSDERQSIHDVFIEGAPQSAPAE